MSQSLLLQLARQSIREVLEAERLIDRDALIREYPILNESIAVAITLYVNEKVRAHFCILEPDRPLIDAVIYNAKVAAFELPQYPPLRGVEFLHAALELSLLTPLQRIEANALETLAGQITPHTDGIVVKHKDQSAYMMPENWKEQERIESVITKLHEALHVRCNLDDPDTIVYKFQTQKAKDKPVLGA